ncbi:bifunctional phosphoribosylaminoimidazolecarboxamide formyltransferase/IMP cyclohydrolase [Roseibacillus ishigakijimensis]|uniref:Bifunctional purine biosynthesis protein PurH n=1 Tax=Roseibacillus ishigakijimensis TaxID=454146 RepID=A0A934RV68_9BACT|nr:bifunctional phosphoribosylaminoimidazolecarboxamide formyltransferase/IMP cyclohydrolase [Roseibacillus ishigakijimensis]
MQRALLSVSDKTGLVVFARRLAEDFGVELLSTGGTASALREAGLEVTEVSDYTGEPELFEGRLKTLHPMIHGGLLQRRDSSEHQAQAKKHNIPPIDLVVVNLYPFEETVAKEGVTLEEAIEKIDIGGPSMLRSAAKNYAAVTVVTDPTDYNRVLEEMAEVEKLGEEVTKKGETSLRLREELALKVFRRTNEYDAAIANYLGQCDEGTAGSFAVCEPLEQELRYGDNPHQAARLYGNFSDYFSQLQGKELSYTNILDIEAAADMILDFKRPTVGILKHTNPCGIGQDDDDLRVAWGKAFETDRQAPFGGVIVCNRPIDEGLARVISEIFTDVIIAPDYLPEARAILQKKKNLRLMHMNEPAYREEKKKQVVRSCPGGLMVMDRDWEVKGLDNLEGKVVSKRPPTQEELIAMRFGWRVVKHVKSNAIVFAGSDRTLGIGAGQMSRVDSSRIAVWKAEQAGLSLEGSVIASDAMFPFADGLDAAIEAGATACIQPGGSIRDEEVIAAADEAGLAMVFTGHRHFRH